MRAALAFLVLAAVLGLAQACAPVRVEDALTLSRPSDYRLVWNDEFDKAGHPDPARWAYDTDFNVRGWHNREKQYYAARRSKNARVSNGRLIIEAHRDGLAARSFPDWGGQDYSSARLVTRGKASWTYGFFEVRAKLPCTRGTWPAIWTLPADKNWQWPEGGEIDIMEHVGHDPGVIHQTVHTSAYNHTRKTHKSAQLRVPDACTAFHDYQLHWTSQGIRMGVDGREVFAFEQSANHSEWPFYDPQYLILNIAVGGEWGGAQGIDEQALPARMEVDYVRVYQPRPGQADAPAPRLQ